MSAEIAAIHRLLRSCGRNKNIAEAKTLHGKLISQGALQRIKNKNKKDAVFIFNSLINMYIRCGAMEEANRVFANMPERDVGSWTTMVTGFAKEWPQVSMQFFVDMQLQSVQPSRVSFLSILPACAQTRALDFGRAVHGQILANGLDHDGFIATGLVDMYAKCGRIQESGLIFDKMKKVDEQAWTAMVSGYAQNGMAAEALRLFRQKKFAGFKADAQTLASVIPACAECGAVELGRQVHGAAIRLGFCRSVFVCNALLRMYRICDSMEVAQLVFDRMTQRDVGSWTGMIAGYAKSYPENALELYAAMLVQGVRPNHLTLASSMGACASLAGYNFGRMIHGEVIRRGMICDKFIGSGLVDMYAKCGRTGDALQAFDDFSQQTDLDVPVWTAMVSGYAQNGLAGQALLLFQQGNLQGLQADAHILVSVLPACAMFGAPEHGKEIHGATVKRGLDCCVFVGSAIVDMYAKCGEITTARHVFDRMPEKVVATWNAMIIGYKIQGQTTEALQIFNHMLESGVPPDTATYAGVLSACAQARLVETGMDLFQQMIQGPRISPEIEHYSCMVNILGRAGKLQEAYRFIKTMPTALQTDVSVWQCLLNASKIHSNIELGELSAKHLIQLDPQNSAPYILLAQLYADAGKWNEVEALKATINERRLVANPGSSWIRVNKKLCFFVIGDECIPQSKEIYSFLKQLRGEMKEMAYSSAHRFVLHDVDSEQKEILLNSHSENLALAVGMINTTPGTTLHIHNNHRICDDCHAAMKFVSKRKARVIVVGDAYCLHIFKDGQCSCKELW